jgi:hypothetical protein
MNKSTPEYIRVRTEIAKKLFEQTYQFTLESEVTKNKMQRVWAFSSWNEMKEGNKDAWRKFADSILEIEGIAILADDQSLPEPCFCPADYCNKQQVEMLKSNFKKVVE